ncbi:MAG: SigE family RNA polymerase sigma factor [Actinomycetota bacterium]|nr:sigma-70 family RNA polymerase sigma factor [Actinomycetota bacterium]
MEAHAIAPQGGVIAVFRPSQERLRRLERWFAAEYPALLRFAYFVSADPVAAEDLVQEAFVRIYRAGSRVDPDTVGPYARAAIVNLQRSSFRRRASERRALVRSVAREHPGPAEPDEMWNAVLQLSPQQRAVIALRFYEDLSEAEIAATLGISTGAVKKHASRAIERLRALVGRQS